jgi:hypothetical protein
LRWIIGIVILLAAVGVHACRVDVPSAAPPNVPTYEWVRTSDGWERRSDWLPPTTLYRPALHPLLVACGETLLAVAALVAFAPARSRSRHRYLRRRAA